MSDTKKVYSFAGKISFLYLAFGLIWILVSDYVFGPQSGPAIAGAAIPLATIKGLGFVLVTALLLYGLLTRLKHRLISLTEESERSERSYRILFEANPVPSVVVSRESGDILRANPAAGDLYGYKPEELESRPITMLAPDFDRSKLPSATPESKGARLPMDHRDRSGSTLKVELNGLVTEFHGEASYLLLIHDQTGWRKAGRERRKALRHLNSAQRVGQLGHWEFRRGSDKIYLSDGAAYILGLSQVMTDNTVTIEQLSSVVYEKDRKYLLELIWDRNLRDPFEIRYRVHWPNNEMRHLLVRGERLENGEDPDAESEDDILWIGSCIDLTERYISLKRLSESERQYRKLVEMLPDGVLLCYEGLITFANPAAARIFRVSSTDELIGQSLRSLVAEAEHNQSIDAVEQANGVNCALRIPNLRFRTPGGETFDGMLVTRTVHLEGRAFVQVLVADVSERVRIKKALVAANQRMRELANRTITDLELERKQIAHALHDEIGQSLTAIKLSSGWLSRKLEAPDALEKVHTVTSIASDIIEKVRDLSLMLRPPQLDELGLVAATQWQASRLLEPAGLNWTLSAERDLPKLDPSSEIVAFRVIQESLTNAVRHSGASDVQIRFSVRGLCLNVEIQDNGEGFDLENRTEHMGLVYMRERVELADGSIRIHSVPGTGTSVRVQLPVSLEETCGNSNDEAYRID
ncbi:PAS domain S-box protein [Marinobacter sp.]|uniref:sensor histidine kinase n=1 Tax=Marinobacter sp. TaxID=50741 RepID=UPI00384AFD6F